MEQECQPQVPQRQPPVGEQGATAADVTVEHGLHIGSPNPAAGEFLPVPRLREVGLRAIELGRMHDRVFEGLAFKSVERVLGDEHADGALRGQKPRRRFNGDPDRLRPIRLGRVARSGLRGGGLVAMERHGGNRQAGTPQKPMRVVPQRTPKPAMTRGGSVLTRLAMPKAATSRPPAAGSGVRRVPSCHRRRLDAPNALGHRLGRA